MGWVIEVTLMHKKSVIITRGVQWDKDFSFRETTGLNSFSGLKIAMTMDTWDDMVLLYLF